MIIERGVKQPVRAVSLSPSHLSRLSEGSGWLKVDRALTSLHLATPSCDGVQQESVLKTNKSAIRVPACLLPPQATRCRQARRVCPRVLRERRILPRETIRLVPSSCRLSNLGSSASFVRSDGAEWRKSFWPSRRLSTVPLPSRSCGPIICPTPSS